MHVDVTRPPRRPGAGALVYESSPYYAGTVTSGCRNMNRVGTTERPDRPNRVGCPPDVSNSQVNTWNMVFIVIHSEAPGSGLSPGIPTVGTDPELLAPKAVIDWAPTAAAKAMPPSTAVKKSKPLGPPAKLA